MRRFLMKCAGVVLALGAGLAALSAMAQEATPEAFVTQLARDLSQAVSTADPVVSAQTVLEQSFDLNAMAAAALPEAFRKDLNRGYVAAYGANLAQSFVTRTLGAGQGELVPIGTRSRPPLTYVGAQIKEDGQLVRMVEFMLRPEGDSYRVVNVAVESLLVTAQQQRDFTPHLISGGVPGLTHWLESAP